jgi:glycosyltransferase involved in cell wall biosynthesis
MSQVAFHIGLQFGHVKHFNEGLAEFSRQLALQYASQAIQLREERNWHFHLILPKQWHGLFGDEVCYYELTEDMRLRHRLPINLDVWHGLHQHMRYRPPTNCAYSVLTIHDVNHVYAKQGLSLWWQNMRLTKQLRRMDKLVAISQYTADDLARYLPWAPPATVIHNGVADLSAMPRTPVDSLADQSFLLHISRMSPSKNVHALIDMAAIWPEQTLVLVGPDSPEVQGHRTRVAAMGLTNVRFLTDVSESQKAWLYAHCQTFLFPSLMEGFGLPPIEAMYFGRPVVVARRTCLPEICAEAALYWDDFQPDSMKQTVQAALAADQQTFLRDRATERARQFSWTTAAQRYCALYQQRHIMPPLEQPLHIPPHTAS